jgi:hypothetical protein
MSCVVVRQYTASIVPRAPRGSPLAAYAASTGRWPRVRAVGSCGHRLTQDLEALIRADTAAATRQAAITGQPERPWVELRCPNSKCPAVYRERYVHLAQAWRLAQQVGRTGVVGLPLAAPR